MTTSDRTINLVVEDNLKAAAAFEAWLASTSPTIVLHAVDSVADSTIRGRNFSDGEPIEVNLQRVGKALVDYEFHGRASAEEVVDALIRSGVPEITAISSSEIYNLRLRSRGATEAIRKADLLASLSTG